MAMARMRPHGSNATTKSGVNATELQKRRRITGSLSLDIAVLEVFWKRGIFFILLIE